MQKDSLASFLHLFHSFGPRRSALTRLLEYFNGDAELILRSGRLELKAAGLKPAIINKIKAKHSLEVDRDLAWAELSGNHLICFDDPAYPPLLKQINDYPALLYARGNVSLLANPQIAIVGSRHCTPGGAQTAIDISSQLASSGLTITSGMAMGIDTQAHLGALRVNSPTIAVAGTGLDRIYPACNRKLAQQIFEQGLLISEFPLGTAAQAANFPQRNRIISGVSLAALVVEAAKRSGSLITARLAVEQGREVFAIPGSIHNPQTRGCHQLIREGAKLVEQTSDIFEELASLLGFVLEQHCESVSSQTTNLDHEHQSLLYTIGYDPVTVDALVGRSGLTIDKLSSMLLVLELNNLIHPAPGGCFVRI